MKIDNAASLKACVLVLCFTLHGCATYWASHKADRLVEDGKPAEAVTILRGLADKNPRDYQLKYVSVRDSVTRSLMDNARKARREGKLELARSFYEEVLKYDPLHDDARQGLVLLERDQREAELMQKASKSIENGRSDLAGRFLGEILSVNPDNARAAQLKKSIDIQKNRLFIEEPALAEALLKQVSLEFRGASLQAILEVLSQSSGLNFIYDRDVKADQKTTIFAKSTTVKDALSVILRTSQLAAKPLNSSTLLIYPSVPEKEKQYEDLVVRTFYLESADPKKVQDMVKTIIAPRSMYMDEKMRTLVVRDNLNTVEAVERLIAAFDMPPPEVMLEVEIFEVSKDSLLNVGVQFPDSVKASVFGAAGKAGQLTVDEVRNLSKDNFQLFFPDPVAVLNLKQTSGNTNTLANPRIRVKSLEKAKVMIGDKVPVITTTTNQTSSATTESVSYLDVGLKLEVSPEIHVNNDVSIDISLEVSNIVKEVKSTTGLLTYQIGSRSANTSLRLKDGETQALAGLIKDEERDSASHLPGLGKLPVIGHLFSNETSNHSKSEIVLLITPHVVRGLAVPDAHVVEFLSGTAARPSTGALRLDEASRVAASKDKDGTTKPVVLTAAPAETVAATPAKQLAAEKTGAVRIDFSSPARVQAAQTFTVPVMLDGRSLNSLDFDLDLGGSGITLVKATPLAPVAGMEATQDGGLVHVRMTGVERHEGPTVMLTLLSGKADKSTFPLAIRNTGGVLADGSAAEISAPPEKKILVAP